VLRDCNPVSDLQRRSAKNPVLFLYNFVTVNGLIGTAAAAYMEKVCALLGILRE